MKACSVLKWYDKGNHNIVEFKTEIRLGTFTIYHCNITNSKATCCFTMKAAQESHDCQWDKFMMLFLIQTKSRTLSPCLLVLKHASTYGMDSVSGKMNSGCLILKVRNYLFSQGTLGNIKSKICHRVSNYRRLPQSLIGHFTLFTLQFVIQCYCIAQNAYCSRDIYLQFTKYLRSVILPSIVLLGLLEHPFFFKLI